MIEPMKKVSIVILNKEREQSLKALRKLGLVHLENIEGSGEKLSAFKETMNNALLSESVLGEIKLPKKKAKAKLLSVEETAELCKEVVSRVERKKVLLDQIASDANELERFYDWGSVNLNDFAYLKEKGISLKMYEIPSDKYNLIDKDIETIVLNKDRKTVRFLILNGGETRPEKLLPQAFEVPFPREDTDFLIKEIKDSEKELNDIQAFYEEKAVYTDSIKNLLKSLQTDIEFETINSGMEREDLGNVNDLAWITGYVPVADMDKFKDYCSKNGWAYAAKDPSDEDMVPTKLKNNKFVSLIYPLTDFLGTVPGYHEFDISGWFLLFFTIFFGMIFGDGGYGVLVTVASIFLLFVNKLKKKPSSPLLGLMLLLGLSTVVWGVVTCTWFGLSADTLRNLGLGILPDISVPVLSNAYTKVSPGVTRYWLLPWSNPGEGLSNSQCLQIFCFILALLQLSVAHIKCVIKDRKSLKILGDLGALFQIWGMFYVILMMVISKRDFPMDAIMLFDKVPIGLFCIAMLGVGFVLSFIFSNYAGSIKDSILESCKNIISVLLGVVNVFSDILSYIRLWAVGLAGSAISGTVNSMAAQIAGGEAGTVIVHAIMFVLMIVLIVFGHGLNMILNLLSVIVHGVRLNTLEFSSHLGMEWSGFKYKPFSEEKV